MIDFIVCRYAIFREYCVEIDNDILHRIGSVVAGIADGRKDGQALPFADVRVKVATS